MPCHIAGAPKLGSEQKNRKKQTRFLRGSAVFQSSLEMTLTRFTDILSFTPLGMSKSIVINESQNSQYR